jgi:outer membrane protein assembly factor BamB
MLRSSIWFTVLLLLGCAKAPPVPAAAPDLGPNTGDWPQWRGPKRDGLSRDTGLLKEWPTEGPPVAWKATDIGKGFSSVAVSGKLVFTMGDLKDGCYLLALDRGSGDHVWKRRVGNTGGGPQGPRCTPTVDGDAVYALGQQGDLVCAEAATGEERWRHNLPKDFKGSSGGWSYTESPLVDGDKLVCTPGGPEASMVALNKKNGDVIWKGVIPKNGDTAGYSSIVAADIGGVRQYVQLMANGLVSFSADKGELLWRYGTGGDRFGHNTANIPTPIVKGDLVFAAAGYGRGAALLKVSKSGDKFTVAEQYWKHELNNKHGGVILVGDYLYGDRDDSGRPWCAEFKTGKVLWRKDDGKGSGSASLTYAEGNLYVRYQDGWMALVPASTERYEEVSGFQIPKPDNSWPHPVVVGGKLYLREQDTLWCYDVKAK